MSRPTDTLASEDPRFPIAWDSLQEDYRLYIADPNLTDHDRLHLTFRSFLDDSVASLHEDCDDLFIDRHLAQYLADLLLVLEHLEEASMD